MRNIIALSVVFCLALPLFAEEPAWDVMSDTWIATDALGRTLPDASETGPPKKDKFIGMFYFLWNGRHGEQGPFDVSKILEKDSDAIQKNSSPPWGPLMVYHHWSESIFGYYVGEDPTVLRKHAQMLADAEVDVIIFDVTNQLTYPETYKPLCQVFDEMRKAGNRVPKIAFLAPFGTPEKVVRELWRDLYSKNEYPELWFRWKGKPLIMADPEQIVSTADSNALGATLPAEATKNSPIGQSFVTKKQVLEIGVPTPTWQTTDSAATLTLYQEKPGGKKLVSKKFTNIKDNAWLTLEPEQPIPPGKYYLELTLDKGQVGWWSSSETGRIFGGEAFRAGQSVNESRSLRLICDADDNSTKKILDFFTFRKPQPSYFEGPTGPNQWSWLEVYPQHGFYTSEEPKKVEQVAVGTAQNAVDGRLGVLSNPRAYGRSFHNGKEPPPEQCDFSGKNFAEQWSRAFELDPEFVFVTGWNEWIMMRFPRQTPFHGSEEQASNFVDQFNREFSRDIEPMRGGHGDAFYYQMISYNRKFKGVRKVEPVKPQPITVDGKFGDWQNVAPEFRDTIGDPVRRDFRGWNPNDRYKNETGLNDIVAAKISFDTEKRMLYFYVRTKDPMKDVGSGNHIRMRLYLDIDGNAKTGRMLGYEFMVAAEQLFRGTTKQEKADDEEKRDWRRVDNVKPSVAGNEMELAVPLKLLGLKEMPPEIHFKWTDGIIGTTWESFITDGDAAPNDRYNYRAVFGTH